jgi:hypothetical protein
VVAVVEIFVVTALHFTPLSTSHFFSFEDTGADLKSTL